MTDIIEHLRNESGAVIILFSYIHHQFGRVGHYGFLSNVYSGKIEAINFRMGETVQGLRLKTLKKYCRHYRSFGDKVYPVAWFLTKY